MRLGIGHRLPSLVPFTRLRRIMTPASTSTYAVCPLSELQDGAMKEVAFGVGGGKVLVARLGDKVVSTSAYCTHYGAPLAKGTLTADGRIVCPWHGACFNASTGDIEDAPAINAIHSFPTSVKDGHVCVTANEKHTLKEEKSRSMQIPTLSVELNQQKGVVIVGGGSGAIHTIESLRENGYTKPITVFTLEDNAPIDRTTLSKGLATDPTKVEWRSTQDLQERYGVILRKKTRVVGVRPKSKEVILEGSSEPIPYETLVLSPGSFPKRLPIPNANLSNVFTLRNLYDTQGLNPYLQKGKTLVIIGSSFIGIELVTAVAKRGLAAIHVVGTSRVPFESILGEKVGEGLMKGYEKLGATFHMKSGLKDIIASKENPEVAEGVVLKDGTTLLKADVILLAVGVKPATEFLKDSGFELEDDGGILVDEYLKVTGYDDIYAIGDIAKYPQTEDKNPRRIEHWNVAGNHGRAVGRTISGKGLPFSKIPIFWSAQGLRYCGLGEKYENIIVQGNPSESKFVAYYTKGDQIVAVATMGKDPVMVKCSELMRMGLMPTAAEINAGVDPLQIDVSTTAATAKIKA